jgi:hypothetical protein
MHKILLLGAALLLSTTALGATLAAAVHHGGERHEAAGARVTRGEGPQTLGSEYRSRRRHGDGERHAERGNDDEATGAPRQKAPDPNAPVPNNGLFNGKARPRVEVQ